MVVHSTACSTRGTPSSNPPPPPRFSTASYLPTAYGRINQISPGDYHQLICAHTRRTLHLLLPNDALPSLHPLNITCR